MTSNPYFRTFLISALWFGFVAFKLVSREPGGFSGDVPQKLVILTVMWVLTALSLGIAATKYQKLRSWGAIALATLPSSLAVMFLMLVVVERVYGPGAPPKFKTTGEKMAYFANEAAKWVKKDRGMDLDYSVESTKIIEEELARISAEVDKANPQPGTFGLACAYGAYVGEALRRKYGGSWGDDHSAAGPGSFPLTISSNTVVFPIGWCWKRLTIGEEDNIYQKVRLITESNGTLTNFLDLQNGASNEVLKP